MDRQKTKKMISMAIALCVLALTLFPLAGCSDSKERYAEAEALLGEGKYEEAAEVFEALGEYKDSLARAAEAREEIRKQEMYNAAVKLMEEAKYEEVIPTWEGLGDYKDAPERAKEAREELRRQQSYDEAVALFGERKYEEAIAAFEVLGEYKDATAYIEKAREEIRKQQSYDKAAALMTEEKYEEAVAVFESLGDYKDSLKFIVEAKEGMRKQKSYDDAALLMKQEKYIQAAEAFEALGNYRDSASRAKEAHEENKKYEAKILTAFTEPQEYEGKIPFADSETVIIKFYLSADAKKITQIDMNAVNLFLLPVNEDSIFLNARVQDALYRGAAEGYNIIDGKITSESLFIFDLTVINSCIYGMIKMKIEVGWGVFITDSVYIVIPNITTSYEIPSNLLK